MRSFSRWLWTELVTARSRPAFRAPHLGLFNDALRALSYSAAVAAAILVLDDPPRIAGVVVVASGMAVLAIVGLARGGAQHQAPPAFLDLVVAPVIATIGLGIPLYSAGLVVLVAALLLMSFQIRARVVLVGVALASAGTLAAANMFGRSNDAAYRPGALILVTSLLLSAAGMLVFEWQRARRALSVSRAQLGTILSGAPVMLCSVSADMTIRSIAGSVADGSWTVGSKVASVMPPALARMVTDAMVGGRSAGDVLVGSRALEISCERVAGGIVVTGFDVTERETARAELEQLVRTKDEFVASISHELRTPLTAVLGFSTELQRAAVLSDEFVPYLDTVVEQSAEMAAIIEDLLVAVRADLDIFTVVDRPVHLVMELDQVVRGLTPRLSKPIEIIGCDAAVLADSGRVRQIIRNLLVNANRYGGRNVQIEVRSQAGFGVLEVRDDGPPIPDALRERMFEPFESTGRVEGRTAALGLGLSVSRRLADLMGGRLRYHHADGWSAFTLELPLIEAGVVERSA